VGQIDQVVFVFGNERSALLGLFVPALEPIEGSDLIAGRVGVLVQQSVVGQIGVEFVQKVRKLGDRVRVI